MPVSRMASSSRMAPVPVMSAVYSGAIEADADVALRGKVVDFVRLDFAQQAGQGAGVRQIAIMEKQPVLRRVRVGVEWHPGVRC